MASLAKTAARFGLPTDVGGVFINLALRLLILAFAVDSIIKRG